MATIIEVNDKKYEVVEKLFTSKDSSRSDIMKRAWAIAKNHDDDIVYGIRLAFRENRRKNFYGGGHVHIGKNTYAPTYKLVNGEWQKFYFQLFYDGKCYSAY